MTNQTMIESKITKSKDGKWVIHKTIITDIKSVKYYEKVLDPDELPKITEE